MRSSTSSSPTDKRTRPSVIPSVTATSPVLSFRQALEEFGQADVLDSGKLATRRAYGHALRALGRANPNIVALDGDTKNSTFSEFFFLSDLY